MAVKSKRGEQTALPVRVLPRTKGGITQPSSGQGARMVSTKKVNTS